MTNSLNRSVAEIFDTYVYVVGITQGAYSYSTAVGLFKSVVGIILIFGALLFWALVGWEIVGNYSMEVKNRGKTIPRAVVISSLTVTVIYLATAAAVQWIDPGFFANGQLKLAMMLTPLFGSFALPVIAVLTAVLCMCAYFQVTGGAARLVASQAGGLFAYRSRGDAVRRLLHDCVFRI